MNKRNEYKHFLNLFANVITLIIEATIFGGVWYMHYTKIIEMPFFRRGNWAVIGFYVLLIFFYTNTLNGYKIAYLRIMDIWLAHSLAILLGGITAFFEIGIIARDYISIKPLLLMMLLQWVIILPLTYGARKMYSALYPPKKLLVVYGKYSPTNLIQKVNTRKDKYDICETVSFEKGYDVIFQKIQKHEGVILCDLPDQTRNTIMKYCYRNSVRTYVTPKISDIILTSADDIHLFDTPLLVSRNYGLNLEQKFIKRGMDIVLGILALIIASPFMLIIALLVKLNDKGPILYKQERLTMHGKKFQILKFRSMRMDSEAKGARLAMKDDDRVTAVGKVIRRIHFDELPQIFNIIKGDMSLVGPRPERELIHNQYKEKIPEFDFRLKVKAGLTGYAQVYGKYNTTPYDKLKFDLTYIETYSVLLDIKILLLTFKILFQKENTEGVDADQITADHNED